MLDPLTTAEIQALRLKLQVWFDLNASPLTRNLRKSSKETIRSFAKSWRILLNNLKRPYIGRAAQRSQMLHCIFLQGFAAADHAVSQVKKHPWRPPAPSHVTLTSYHSGHSDFRVVCWPARQPSRPQTGGLY
jgi:hypothetical protein